MKYIKEIVFFCFLILVFGLFVVTPLVFAEEQNKISVPNEAFFPLGALLDENPALFDVVSEPIQSIKSSSNPIVFLVVLLVFFLLLVFFIVKIRKNRLVSQKMKL